jgi:hypothetical protein
MSYEERLGLRTGDNNNRVLSTSELSSAPGDEDEDGFSSSFGAGTGAAPGGNSKRLKARQAGKKKDRQKKNKDGADSKSYEKALRRAYYRLSLQVQLCIYVAK